MFRQNRRSRNVSGVISTNRARCWDRTYSFRFLLCLQDVGLLISPRISAIVSSTDHKFTVCWDRGGGDKTVQRQLWTVSYVCGLMDNPSSWPPELHV